MEIESLTTIARRRATTAIENTHREYFAPEGLRAMEAKRAEAEGRCSVYIFTLAQFATENCPQGRTPEQVFSALCLYAEAQFKEKHGVSNVKEVLPVWAVFKSNILAGLRAGLNPVEFTTEWGFRKATAEERRAQGPQEAREKAGQGEGKGKGPVTRRERQETLLNAPPRPVVVQRAEDMLELTTIRPRLREMVAQLMVAAEYVKPDRTAEAEEVLQEAINALSRLVDRRRIRDTATKQALNAAVLH